MEKIKPIVLEFEDGVSYTLEFNRDSVKYAESRGFSRNDIGDKLMTRVPELFYYAFRMHHPTIPMEKTNQILFEDLGGLTDKQVERLAELFNAPYNYLVNDTGKTKNSKLRVLM